MRDARFKLHATIGRQEEAVMAHPVRAIPEGYHSISPSLTCKDAARAIDFYKNVFGAVEMVRMPSPDGKISHEIGRAHV